MRHLTIQFSDGHKVTEIDSSLIKCYAIATSKKHNSNREPFHVRTATIDEVVEEESKRLDLCTNVDFLAAYEHDLQTGYIEV